MGVPGGEQNSGASLLHGAVQGLSLSIFLPGSLMGKAQGGLVKGLLGAGVEAAHITSIPVRSLELSHI